MVSTAGDNGDKPVDDGGDEEDEEVEEVEEDENDEEDEEDEEEDDEDDDDTVVFGFGVIVVDDADVVVVVGVGGTIGVAALNRTTATFTNNSEELLFSRVIVNLGAIPAN